MLMHFDLLLFIFILEWSLVLWSQIFLWTNLYNKHSGKVLHIFPTINKKQVRGEMENPKNNCLITFNGLVHILWLQHIQNHEYLFHYYDMTHMFFFLHFMPQTIFGGLQQWKGDTWLKKILGTFDYTEIWLPLAI